MIKVICKDEKLLPQIATDGSAGYDLKFATDVQIFPGKVEKVGTGVRFEIPKGYVGLIVPRSSNGEIAIINETGVIDSDYQGEIFLKLKSKTSGTKLLYKYDSLFQMVIVPCLNDKLVVVDSFDVVTDRGEGGFGSTDKKR
jgi:dUTP pyrophosphatase